MCFSGTKYYFVPEKHIFAFTFVITTSDIIFKILSTILLKIDKKTSHSYGK